MPCITQQNNSSDKIRMDLDQSENLKMELMMAQETSFAKVLAGNDKRLRDKAVKKLMKWLTIRSKSKASFTEDNFQRIWSGLFYCMWMSDKYLVQEELAESISKLIHCFHSNTEAGLLFIKCFNKIMSLEWAGIDQHRLDKFSMLVRRFLRQSLDYCKRKDWNKGLVKSLVDVFEEFILTIDGPLGLTMHFIDIYPEEIAKVSKGELNNEIIMILLDPIVKLVAMSKDARIHRVVSLLFDHLIRQTDIGIEYEEKYNAWKQLRMPCDRPEDLELCPVEYEAAEEENNDEDVVELVENSALDPRAGKVDAILPQIPINFDDMISLIKKHRLNKFTTSRGRKSLNVLEEKFMNLKKGKVPEKIRKPAILNEKKTKHRRLITKSVKELMKFNKKLNEKDLELSCDEVDEEDTGEELDEDSDDAQPEDVESDEEMENVKNSRNGGVGGKPVKGVKLKTKEASKSQEFMKKLKLKSYKKKRKEKNREKVREKNSFGNKPLEFNNSLGTNKKCVHKSEVGEEKRTTRKSSQEIGVPVSKPKSPKDAFRVEDVGKEHNGLNVTTKRKRSKSLGSWEVQNIKIDTEEYDKIVVPKIIRLETKVSSPVPVTGAVVKSETKDSYNFDTPVKKITPQMKLTPVFWDKAKAKVTKKRKSRGQSVQNSFFGEEQPKNSRRISFALERNEAQENDEYLEEVKNSPRIPFDGSKRPNQSALKCGLLPSPINPFYRFKKV